MVESVPLAYMSRSLIKYVTCTLVCIRVRELHALLSDEAKRKLGQLSVGLVLFGVEAFRTPFFPSFFPSLFQVLSQSQATGAP